MAKKGIVTDEVGSSCCSEGIAPEQLSEDIAAGVSVIPINTNHQITPIGIGRG